MKKSGVLLALVISVALGYALDLVIRSNGASSMWTSVSALEVARPVSGCTQPHYLVGTDVDGTPAYNRLQWFTKAVPPTGKMEQPLRCEFSPALATVVGSANGGEQAAQLGFRTIEWDHLASPNDLQGVPLSIRTQRPVSEPVIQRVQAHRGGSDTAVLVNAPSDGQPLRLAPTQQRPSLWIDFAIPQRAVGLEYGYEELVDQPRDELETRGIVLIAYDAQGQELTRSEGDTMGAGLGSLLASNDFAQIGVHDMEGHISTVELRFTGENVILEGDQSEFIHEPQVVSRIWFEPLPPAVVTQGVLALDVHWTPGTPGVLAPPPISALYPGVEIPARPIVLPFECDTAAVFVRGFSLKFADFQPRPVDNLLVGIDLSQTGRAVTLTPRGRISTSEEPFAPYRLIVYYTLVAWDARQVELRTASANVSQMTAGTDIASYARYIDPCRNCGSLFAGLQQMEFSLPQPVELEVWQLQQGYQQGFGALANGNSGLANGAWSLTSRIIPDGDPGYGHTITGTVLSGRGLQLGPDDVSDLTPADRERVRIANEYRSGEFPIPQVKVGPRTNPAENFIFPISQRATLDVSWPVTGDMAFLSLALFGFRPDGPFSEISVEAKAEAYNGRIVDWQLGLGVDTTPLITNVDSASWAQALPVFGAIQRHDALDEPKLEASPLIITNASVGCSTGISSQAGSLRNAGRGQALIREVVRGNGPDDDLFDFQFEWRRQQFTFDELLQRLPLQLRPGEDLLVRARYTPDRSAGTPGTALPPHHAILDFRTAHPAYPNVRLTARGSTAGPATGNAEAEWRPATLDFGYVPVGQERTRTALLVSTGTRPLCVNRFLLEDTTKGFWAVLGPQIEPEVINVRVTYREPTMPRSNVGELGRGVFTALIAETNAGRLRLPLSANAVQISAPAPDIPVCMTPEDYFRGCRNP